MKSTKLINLLLAIILASVLNGFNMAEALPPTSDRGKSHAGNLLIGTKDMANYSQVKSYMKNLKETATAQEIVNFLISISALRVVDQDRGKVAEMEASLLSRLRGKVKSEVLYLHQTALKSTSYRTGYEALRQAGTVLALYPLSDNPSTIKEAEELSIRQNEVMRRLELIRIQRYNYWAAGQIEKALMKLREKGKDGSEPAIGFLRIIEPSMLESSVASLYSYAVNEIMDIFKKDKKATVVKRLTDSSVIRRGLEDF